MNNMHVLKVSTFASQWFLVFTGIVTLFTTGLSKPVPYHFSFSGQPDSFAPAFIVILIFPALLGILYYFVRQKDEALTKSELQISLFCVCAVVISHLFLCVYAIYFI